MAKPEALEAGCVVSVDLIPGTAPHNCYWGLVQAIDKHGMRIHSAEWDDGLNRLILSKEDFYIPWVNINSMLVSTE